jgi:hypothetical protein
LESISRASQVGATARRCAPDAQSRTLATVPKIVKHVHLTYRIRRRYRNGKLTTAVPPIGNIATRNSPHHLAQLADCQPPTPDCSPTNC